MELVKNIFFNTDKLTQNSKVKISYTGKFFQDDSEDVYIHYGFGFNWDNLGELKMEKTELGFQAEIDMPESDSFNFCFRNSKNEWDNNDATNYSFPIELVSTDLIAINEENTNLRKHKKLRRTYMFSKKLRLAIYKVITILPKLISGNYKKKVNNE